MMSNFIKQGDIFEIIISEHRRKFFQYIANDITQLNSDVIRVFKKDFPIDKAVDLDKVSGGMVDFYAHCVIKSGLRQTLWKKVGHSNAIGELDHIIFRGTNDYGKKVGEQPIKISSNWFVWKINDPQFTKVGHLDGINRKAELGIVINPFSIVHRTKTGSYDFSHPGFE